MTIDELVRYGSALLVIAAVLAVLFRLGRDIFRTTTKLNALLELIPRVTELDSKLVAHMTDEARQDRLTADRQALALERDAARDLRLDHIDHEIQATKEVVQVGLVENEKTRKIALDARAGVRRVERRLAKPVKPPTAPPT